MIPWDTLRDYQQASIDGLRSGYRDGHRSQMLVAPTGAGKTLMSGFLLQEASSKGNQSAFVVDRVSLVDQTSAVLDQYGIDHGIIQAGHWRYRPNALIQICSAQTIEKRGFFPGCKLLVVDEAHTVRKATADLIKNVPTLRVLGLSATPFSKGLCDLYSNVVNVTTTDELVERGYLAPMTVYAAKAADMTGAKVVAGEWAEKEIEERGLKIVGDIVQEWISKTALHFGGPVKTIVFSATVAHGAELCRQFQEAGFNFQQISYKDKDDDRRREIIEEFRRPNSAIVGIVAAEILTKGFDVPDVKCGISARPYRKSLSSHVQQLGRVMRTDPSKEFALWLCHSGNYLRFHDDMRMIFAQGVQKLDDRGLDSKTRPEPTERQREAVKCACGYVLPPNVERCPACGRERTKRSMVETVAGTMVLINGKPTPATGKLGFLADRNVVWAQLVGLGMSKYEGDPERARRFAQAKYRDLYGEFARKTIEHTTPIDPTMDLIMKIRKDAQNYARRRSYAERATA